jgi:uncharacterized membrane protein YfcA
MTPLLFAALIVGLTIGMLGSGGSVLTVPALIYWIGHSPKVAIAESMAIVGTLSAVLALTYARAQLVDWHSVWSFGLPGMLGTLAGAWLGGIAPEPVQMGVFGTVLLLAAYLMLSHARQAPAANRAASPTWVLALQGTAVGMLTGFVGVGGGFLIVPALVVLGRLPIRLAVGTSLVIITLNATIGFVKYEHFLRTHDLAVDGQTILAFVLLGFLGSLVGRLLNARLDQRVLQQIFAGLLLLVGGFILLHQVTPLTRSVAQAPLSTPNNQAASLAHLPTSNLGALPCTLNISTTRRWPTLPT